MTKVPVETAAADFVDGALYAADEPHLLSSSMLFLRFGEYGIDVSWYPERDPTGCYFVTLFKGDWDTPLYEKETTDPAFVKGLVEESLRAHEEQRHAQTTILRIGSAGAHEARSSTASEMLVMFMRPGTALYTDRLVPLYNVQESRMPRRIPARLDVFAAATN